MFPECLRHRQIKTEERLVILFTKIIVFERILESLPIEPANFILNRSCKDQVLASIMQIESESEAGSNQSTKSCLWKIYICRRSHTRFLTSGSNVLAEPEK